MPSLYSRVLRFIQIMVAKQTKPMSIQEGRDRMDRAVKVFSLPRGTLVTPVTVDGIYAEWIDLPGTPGDRVILYLHGGTFTYGSTKSHRFIVAPIVKAANTRALLINYRLAPENPFPAAVDDCHTAYRWLLAQGFDPSRVVIMGDSAGGGLTVSTLLAAREAGDPLPAGGVCLCPGFNAACDGETYRTLQHKDFVLDGDRVRETVAGYAGTTDLRNPILSPIYADLHDLPPLLIHIGSDEVLLSDATMLADHARTAGVDVTLKIWPGMWHVFHMYAAVGMPEARQAVREIGVWVKERMKG